MLYDGLDPGIAPYVEVLRSAGIETYESCEGGEGHCYSEPTIRFYGQRGQGFRALAVALQNGLPISAVRQAWTVDEDGLPNGPYWEVAFWRPATCPQSQASCSDGSAGDQPSPPLGALL
jgi:hypothetical protein